MLLDATQEDTEAIFGLKISVKCKNAFYELNNNEVRNHDKQIKI